MALSAIDISMEHLRDPVIIIRAFYLAASLLVLRHRSALIIND